MSFSKEELVQLDKLYQEVSKGTETPHTIMIYCEICRESFTLQKGKVNEICTHLKDRFKAPEK